LTIAVQGVLTRGTRAGLAYAAQPIRLCPCHCERRSLPRASEGISPLPLYWQSGPQNGTIQDYVLEGHMTHPLPTKEDVLGHLPQDLLEALRGQVTPDSVQAASPYDLDPAGRYTDSYLVLTEEQLGQFHHVDGSWSCQWQPLDGLSGAAVVEGLGMGLLRLLAGDRTVAEYRFSLRHAKAMAKLQRKLERRLSGKDESDLPPERGKPDEKKIRCETCGHVIPPWSETCPACLSKRKVLSRLADFVKPYKWQAITGFALAILVTIDQLIRPSLTKPMLDKGLGLSKGGLGQGDYVLLLKYVAVLAGLILFAAVTGALRQRLMGVLGSKISRDIRDRTYDHLHKLSLSYFSKKPTGSLVTRITSDSDRIWDFVAFTVIEASTSILTILGVGVALFILDWRLACIVLLPIPLVIALTIYFHKRLHTGFDQLFHRWGILTAVVADALPGVRVIKAFGQEKREVKRFWDQNADFYGREVSMVNLWTLFGPLTMFCLQVGTILVWLVGGYWVVHRQMTPGTLMAFTGYMWMFYGPIHMVAHIDRMLNRAASSVQRIFEVLDTEPAIFSKAGALPARRIDGAIELRDVSFSYDGIRKVLKNVSLKIDPGYMIGLAGPSGGGKSTLVNLVCRFYDVLEGQILIDGTDVREYDVESLRRHIGVVLQEPFLFHGTVASNIAYGHPHATIDQVIEAAKAANAHDFIVGFPDGYDTLVGERGHTLSGGERQRISIARAILNNPTILILDEATSSVDTETEKLIQEALDRLIANRTTIAIAHRLSTLRKADRLVILDKGVIVEQGTHEELRDKEDGVYAKLVRMQSEMQAIIAIAG
jgi:ATP-binding cassette subfamily B protein